MKKLNLLAAFLWLCSSALAADAPPAGKDWPQFLGPTRDGVYAGGDLVDQLSAEPKIVWKAEVGHGWASPVVVDGKVLIFHRVKDEAVLDCLDAATGKQIWRSAYPTDYKDGFDFDPGPRATPAVSNGRVFTFGAEGLFRAVELQTGKEIWKVDTVKTYQARNGFFGLACSPIVCADTLVLTIGGKGMRAFISLDAKTGKLQWSAGGNASGGIADSEAGYSSPTIARFGDEDCVVAIDRESLNIIGLTTGRLDNQMPFRSRQEASVNAATPLIVGNEVFVTASYGVGAKLLRYDPATFGKKNVREIVWENDDSLSSHYATPVVKDGFLFGFHGRQEQGPALRCVEWATGKVRWSQDDFGAGTVTLAGDKLVVLTEAGVLRLIAASPDGYKELGHAQILPATVRAYPAIANGMLFARGQDQLVCVDLRKAK